MANQESKVGSGQTVLLVILILVALALVGLIGYVLLERMQDDPLPPEIQHTTDSAPSSTGEELPSESESEEATLPTYIPAPNDPEDDQQNPGANDDPSQDENTSGGTKSIYHVEHANLYTGVRLSTGGNSLRNKVIAAVVSGKGYQGSSAIAYILADKPSAKEESNELILSYGVLSGTGFQQAQIMAASDVLWFWINTELSSDQLLHVNVNSKNLAVNTPVYTIANGRIQTVNYNADHTKVTAMGPVPYTMDSKDQSYARIKLSKGWSGWIGIPVAGFSLKADDVIDTVIFRLYGKSGSLNFGDVMYLDELQIAGSNTQPKLHKASNSYSTAQYAQNPGLFVPVWKGKWTVPAGMLDFEEKYRQFFDPNGRVLSVAHRADRNGYYPENSLEGVLSSIHAGADIIEVDLAKTSDGHLVLMHDATITATTNINILRAKGLADHLPSGDYVAQWTLAQLQELRLLDDRNSCIVTDYTIPTLRDVIKVCKDRVFITLDKTDRFDWYPDIWPLMQELGAYRTVMVPYNYTTSIGYAKTAKMLSDIKNACGYDAVYMADARSGSLPYVTSEIEANGIPKALRISEYDPAKHASFMLYTGNYRIYAETIKTGVDVALWTEMADRGYNIIMGWGDIYSLTKFIAQRHFS